MNSFAKKAKYVDLFLKVTDPIFLLNLEGEILESNPCAVDLLGSQKNKAHFLEIVGEENHELVKKALRKTARKYYPFSIELGLSVSNRIITHECLFCQLELLDSTHVIQVICRNIQDRLDAEAFAASYLKELTEANRQLHDLSITDKMTGLNNYRYFADQLKAETDRCRRYKGIFSIVYIDIDHFKNYNDANGHLAGDALLSEFASILKSASRDTDICARYGGEEFVVLCVNTGEHDALNLAERVRRNTENHPFKFKEKQPLGSVTVSIGVAEFNPESKEHLEVVKNADRALYFSKENGRNLVTLYSKVKNA